MLWLTFSDQSWSKWPGLLSDGIKLKICTRKTAGALELWVAIQVTAKKPHRANLKQPSLPNPQHLHYEYGIQHKQFSFLLVPTLSTPCYFLVKTRTFASSSSPRIDTTRSRRCCEWYKLVSHNYFSFQTVVDFLVLPSCCSSYSYCSLKLLSMYSEGLKGIRRLPLWPLESL